MSLRHAELKAERAREHLEDLKRALQAYYDSNPCAITLYRKPEIGRRALRVEIKDLSDRTYLLVGDFAHNLRSVLDHIVYSLIVEATCKVPESKSIQWPVLQAWEKADKATFNRQTNGVPDAASTIIEELQPFHAAGGAFKEHALWQLHKLDIVDKHRRVAINQQAFTVGFPTLSPTSDFTQESGEGYFEVTFPIEAAPVPMDYNPRPEIRFGAAEEDLFLTPERLEEIYRFVTLDVLPRFRQFFKNSGAPAQNVPNGPSVDQVPVEPQVPMETETHGETASSKGKMNPPEIVFAFPDPREFMRLRKAHPSVIESIDAIAEGFTVLFDGIKQQDESKEKSVLFIMTGAAYREFEEVLTLGLNGYGAGATKLLRALYERTVTILYLMKHPEKVQQFIDFTAVHWHKLLTEADTSGVGEQLPQERRAEIERDFKEVENNFTETVCAPCKKTRLQGSWTKKPIPTQAREISKELGDFCFGGYLMPTFFLHTTFWVLISR